MDRRDIGDRVGQKGFLEKKVPKNQKFANIEPTVNTGQTAKNQQTISKMNKLIKADKLIAKRKGELFKRMKAPLLASLIEQDNNQESIYNINKEEENTDTMSQASSFTQKSVITQAYEQLTLGENSEFLLVDLRQESDYQDYHIKEAINFPSQLLNQDRFTPDILKFKNKENKIIVIYHFDEKGGCTPATLFCEKGYDNVILLSEGIEEFQIKFHHLLVGKKIPEKQVPKEKAKIVYKRTDNSSLQNSINPKSLAKDKDNQSITSSSKFSLKQKINNI